MDIQEKPFSNAFKLLLRIVDDNKIDGREEIIKAEKTYANIMAK